MKFRTTISLSLTLALLAGGSLATASASAVATVVDEKGNEGLYDKPADQGRQDTVEAVEAIRQLGPAKFADVYAGVGSTESDMDTLQIALTVDDQEVKDQLLKASKLPSDRVTFRVTPVSERSVLETIARLTKESDDLRREGFDIRSFFGNADFTAEVWLKNGTPEQAAVLHERYGQTLVVTTEFPDLEPTADRAHDGPEWYTGDFLSFGGPQWSGGCTSGFPMINPYYPNKKYILTAGHCYQLGESVYNGINPPVMIGGWNSNLVGQVTNDAQGPNGVDALLISADGSRSIWTGGTAGTSLIQVQAVTNPWLQLKFCISGAYEGTTCDFKIQQSNAGCQLYGDFNYSMCGQFAFLSSGNNQAIGAGDSGAGAFGTYSGTTYALGIQSTGSLINACTNWNSYYPANNKRQCGSYGTITQIGTIQNTWGIQLDP